jgi:hypothetical protein
MIAITSHRPLDQEPEIKRNQLLAKRTWESVFSRIIYFGVHEHELVSGKTAFIPCEEFPRIRDIVDLAGKQRGFVAILNADIVVNPDIKKLERMMMLRGKLCASSRRYHFDPDTCDWKAAQLGNDRGRDIFIARNDIWRDAVNYIPHELRIGNGRWDAWVTDWFRTRYNDSFIDFTDMRVIFHPNHESRRRPYEEEISKVQFYIAPV